MSNHEASINERSKNSLDGRRGFHGPRYWAVSVCAGVAAGALLWLCMPAQYPPGGAGGAGGTGSTVVIQTRADGSRVVRHEDGSASAIAASVDVHDETAMAVLAAGAPMRVPGAGAGGAGGTATPSIPLLLCAPFALLLLSIAVMPLLNQRFWHAHFTDVSFFLGSLVLAYFLLAFGGFGRHEMAHAAGEYYSFIALVGGLYVVSGGILLDIRARGRPLTNTLLLGMGAVLANLVGTTGASVLLIRPFMRMNRGRLRPAHAVFFIFIVANCAGSLTPIGDPPLYLGFLKGVPFSWTLVHLWPMWLVVNGMLLGIFWVYDSTVRPPMDDPALFPLRLPEKPAHGRPTGHEPVVVGWRALGVLVMLIGCVFVDPAIGRAAPGSALAGFPVGATLQVLLTLLSLGVSPASVRRANQFTFAPVKEVGVLFIGIFLTMAPALAYLRAHAAGFGLETPTQFYFGTGLLSAVLDNAPTYLSFLQVALGVLHLPLDPRGIAQFIEGTFDIVHLSGGDVVHFNGRVLLEAVSLGSVFFGALTYIGNGPNFMVKSIVESAHGRGEGLGVKMPSFGAYVLLAAAVLMPVLAVNWLLFVAP